MYCLAFGMSTLPHLMLQPRSRRSQQRRRHRLIMLAVLLGVAMAVGAYLLH
jgi:sulfite exporter TauE/SafE